VLPANDLESLDEMIAGLGGGSAGTHSSGPCKLLLEHLRSARTSFLGSMPGEYRSSLEEARESAVCIPDKTKQTALKQRLKSMIGD
jgi:hypothetical protein